MGTDVKTWIIEWFKENVGLNEHEIKNGSGESYFEKGWIDSFKFISFVSDIEKAFDIRFSNDEFQDRGFATIDGLAKITERKISGRKQKV